MPVNSIKRYRWFRRTTAVLILPVGLGIAAGSGVVLPYFLAAWTARIAILILSAVLVVAAVVWLGAWSTALIWPLQRRQRFAAITSIVITGLFTAALYFMVLRPSPLRPRPSPGENTRYWQLPTGSRIAYSEYDPPSGVSAKPEPIVFLHGGPGLAVSPFEVSFFSQFAADGYRVDLFDQAGSGLSSFLRVREYSVQRSVDDVEAIRQQIGAERLILIGHSWGSTLEASYIAKYPTHVAKVVFYSPGPIWAWERYSFDRSRAARPPEKPVPVPLRLLAALYLSEKNPDAAEKLLPQEEAEGLQLTSIAPLAYEQVCSGDTQKLPAFMTSLQSDPNVNPGFNPYVIARLDTEIARQTQLDPHPLLQGNHTPAIVLFSECDFVPWTSSLDYRRTFANAKVYYIPRSGHIISLSQPDLMARIIRAFLLDKPDPTPPYMGDADPRTIH